MNTYYNSKGVFLITSFTFLSVSISGVQAGNNKACNDGATTCAVLSIFGALLALFALAGVYMGYRKYHSSITMTTTTTTRSSVSNRPTNASSNYTAYASRRNEDNASDRSGERHVVVNISNSNNDSVQPSNEIDQPPPYLKDSSPPPYT